MTKAQHLNLSIAAKSRGDELMAWYHGRRVSSIELTDTFTGVLTDIFERIERLETK